MTLIDRKFFVCSSGKIFTVQEIALRRLDLNDLSCRQLWSSLEIIFRHCAIFFSSLKDLIICAFSSSIFFPASFSRTTCMIIQHAGRAVERRGGSIEDEIGKRIPDAL